MFCRYLPVPRLSFPTYIESLRREKLVRKELKPLCDLGKKSQEKNEISTDVSFLFLKTPMKNQRRVLVSIEVEKRQLENSKS